MKSLITKSLVPSVLITVSLALTGSTAMAAKAQIHHRPTVTHVTHPQAARVAARYRQPQFTGNNLGQLFQGFFGGFLPPQYAGQIAAAAARASASHRGSGTYDSSPSYDYTSTTTDTSSAVNDAQAASDAESQAIQQMNDTNALNASMAAAEQENDVANAATLQTEINAGF